MRINNVSIHIAGKQIVKPLNFSIKKGEIFVLMGPSGSGKTTLLRAIAKLLPITSGSIDWERGSEGNVGIAFQEPRLFPHMTVWENLTFGLRVRGMKKKERKRYVKQFIDILQLQGLEDRYPHELSGGQKQRVSLGRSILLKPDLLLLDEPFSSLDTSLRHDLTEWLYELQRKQGFSLLWVTHYIDEAFSVADTLGVMLDGQLLQVGTPYEVYEQPNSEQVAAFFALPNRFSKEKWLSWIPAIEPKHEMGWISMQDIRLTTPDEAPLTGVIQRVAFEKNGYIVTVKVKDDIWQVFSARREQVPNVQEKVGLQLSTEHIKWYPYEGE